MNRSRIIGNNITLELQKLSISLDEFATLLDYSIRDVYKLLEGRLYVTPFQLEQIASILKIRKEELLEERDAEVYNSLIHNFRKFKNPENQELVLDLIDMYADLEEALARS